MDSAVPGNMTMSKQASHLSDVECNALRQPEQTLPASSYFDPDFYARELREIWAKRWIFVCRSDDLSESLCYRTLIVGDQNIVVLRDTDGKLSAFHNVCRHRGSILCKERSGRLGSRLLVCPYHQWSYATTDGRLVRTTSFAEPDGFKKGDFGLFGVALTEWRGCVFVNLDPHATFGAAEAFQRPPDNLVNFPMEKMVSGHVWTKQMSCNWKVFWENFNECLHCPNIHPELSELVPMFQRRIINPRDVPDWQQHADSDDPKFRGGMRDGAETWSTDAGAQGRVISELTAEDHARGHTYATAWPSVFVAGYPDHVRIVRLLPLGPERMEIQAEWLFPQETLDDQDYDISKVVDFGILVMEQDAQACELNQQGFHALPFQEGVLMPEEYLLKRFHDWVRVHVDA